MVDTNGAHDLTDEERALRIQAVIEQEARSEIAWWWLSFADPHAPEGQRFLGVAIVPGRGVLTATTVARDLNLNPGGECVSAPLPVTPPSEFLLTLMDAERAEEANKALARIYAEENTESLVEAAEEPLVDDNAR